ncbi:MAG: FAD-binding protein [Gemmatimonadota bacterium]|nr:MAG: FAD-binding protein [Gemmatimonadota bacterium]
MASPALSEKLLKQLRAVVGRGNVLTEPGELLAFESDALTAYRATPAAVVFVHSTEEIQAVVSALHMATIPFVPRGAGTGLSGGAVADGAVIVELSRMNRILWIDAENRRARVQPGVINARLNEVVAPQRLMYAPDPSSEAACTLGGNVAENAGGPHCLKYGVTSNHIVGLTVVAPGGAVIELPGPDGPGYDLVGLFVGSEGTLGICSEIEVRLVPVPAAVGTLLAHFDDIEGASRAVSAIIAAGIVPAALEMIDQNTLKAVEASVYAAGFPTDVAASLIVELDGPGAGLAEQVLQVEELLAEHGARQVGVAASETERTKFWKARKSAFGAMGRIGSDLFVQDATVPRSKLPEMLARVYEIAKKYDLTITNVFHAGDGNLHPNIPFDRREGGVLDRVYEASKEIIEASVAAGGTITGEHGVGVDKRKYMSLVFSDVDRQVMRWVKQVFDPAKLCNPKKILPDEPETPVPGWVGTVGVRRSKAKPDEVAGAVEVAIGSACLLDKPGTFIVDGAPAEVVAEPESLEELAELMQLAGKSGWAVVPVGHGGWLNVGNPHRHFDLVITMRRLNGVVEHHPDDLLATVLPGTSLRDLGATLAGVGQWWPLDPLGDGTVGATIATGSAGPLAAAFGTPRDLVLGLTVIRPDGRVVKAGGRVVKNVAGYDMVKLYTGSWGTLGIIAKAHLRLHALPQADRTRLYRARGAGELAALAMELVASGRLAPAAAEIASPAAARALDVETDDWVLIVRWLGHKAAVNDAVRGAKSAAARRSIRVESRDRIWGSVVGLEDSLRPALAVRANIPLRAVEEFVRQATPFCGGETPPLLASPLTGRIWIFVPRSLYGAASSERLWTLRVEELRREAREGGGVVRVERAPTSLRRIVDPWGDPGAAQQLISALKIRFDPDAILKPGFFVGEL